VPEYGFLFESFLTTHAPKRTYDSFTKAKNDAGGGAIEDEVSAILWSKMSSKWYGWMLSAMAQLSDNGKQQMSHLTRFIKFLGLSRLGQNALQSIGVLNTLRYSDQKMSDANDAQRAINRYHRRYYHSQIVCFGCGNIFDPLSTCPFVASTETLKLEIMW
jgi:hypothetical protein